MLAVVLVPAHVNETTDPVDNFGGVLSVALVAALVLGINFAAVPSKGMLALGLGAIAAAAAVAFVIRQRRAASSLYDLDVAAPRSAKLVEARGARVTLTGSVPVSQAGMAFGMADRQRDLGGAIVQSILGALLTAGYASAVAAALASAPNADDISQSVESQLQKSFASAEDVAQQYPQYSDAIVAGAKSSFLDGADWAYTAGIVAILLGATVVFTLFPKHEDEERLLGEYAAEDARAAATRAEGAEGQAPVPAAG